MVQQVKKEPRLKQEGREEVPKKTYVPPELTEYGNVEKLTRNGGVTGADAMLMQSCL